MVALKIILGIIYLLICLALIILVLLQDSKGDGVSALGVQSDSFFNKNKGGSKEVFLGRMTVVLGIAFAVFAIATTIVIVL